MSHVPQPKWITPAGDFGTYTEGFPLTKTFVATPAFPGGVLQYYILNGTFPDANPSFSLNETTGVLTGTPYEVAKTTLFEFTIRVFEFVGTIQKNFNDRTFSFYVQGATPPIFITPAGDLYPGPTYLPDSTWNPYQILVDNPDPGTASIIRIVNGVLPEGIEMNNQGLIRGYASQENGTYPFTLQVESSSGTSTRDFQIVVVQQTLLTRPPAILNTNPPTFNVTFIDPNAPYYISSTGNIGTFSQDNNFLFKICGESFDSGSISYSRTGTLPPGITDNIQYNTQNVQILITAAGSGYSIGDQLKILGGSLGGVDGVNDLFLEVAGVDGGTLTELTVVGGLNVDSFTEYTSRILQTVTGTGSGAKCTILKINAGWLSGTFTNNPSLIVETYTFTYTALNNDNGLASPAITFTINVVAQENNVPVGIEVEWLTDENLGSINNGTPSTLFVEAVNSSGLPLEYTLFSGTLPPDLMLNIDGTISGTVAWEPLDILSQENASIIYSFTVLAQNVDYPEISSQKTFYFNVYQKFGQPYDNLYIRSYFDIPDRLKLDSLLQDEFLIPQEYVYRVLDPNFGKSTDVVYHHMYGVPSSTIQTYIAAVEKNHYRRNLTLGPIRTAVARNGAGTVLYEVVYSEIVDNLVNNNGVSISKKIVWPYPINGVRRTLYPNSLPNMRQQIADFIGQDTQSALLPLWMSCQQLDGSILGFTPSWVICYTKPGYSELVKNTIISPFQKPITVIKTSSLDNTMEVDSTDGFWPGMRVQFSGDGFGGITIGMRYQVQTIVDEKHFTITTSMYTGPVTLTNGTGKMSMEHVDWEHTLNELNFKIDRFEVGKGLTYSYDPVTESWTTLPSGVDATDSHDDYVMFQKNILG